LSDFNQIGTIFSQQCVILAATYFGMKKIMVKKYFWIWLVLPVSLFFLSFCFSKNKKTPTELPGIILQTLAATHYDPIQIDDTFSLRVYDLYLKRLDRSKRYFLQEDYDKFEQYKYQIDEQSQQNSFEFFDLVSTTFDKRLVDIEKVFEEILASPFDYNVSETYIYDEEKRSYAKSGKELKEEWRKYLKYAALEKYYAKVKQQEQAVERGDKDFKVKPLDSLEQQAREEVLKMQRNWTTRLKKFDRSKHMDMYLNCLTESFDPHTSYYPPKEKEDFDIRMSGRLEGIGAQLSERDGEIKVEMVVPGSPSYLQGELKEGDIIIKVAQKDSQAVDVRNMELSDAVQLVRGKKGTTVVLTVRKPDGSIKEIPIVRDVVIMEEGYAKSALLKNGKDKVGYIYLPQFYTDMNGRGGRTCSKDVKDEVQKLMKENIDGLVLDLRNNGGGSLQDVVDMAGLFVGAKPIVQAKYRDSRPDILISRERKIIYTGPLVILVNKYSASASEILAAALQDYDRALIIGTNDQTFGKGTVQRFLDLDRFANTNQGLGSVKVTIQKFYRVNGGTTQLQGVVPDIIMPERFASAEVGERSEDYPLKWNEITPLPLQMDIESHKGKIEKAVKKFEKRKAKNEVFELIEKDKKRIETQRKKTDYPLQYDAYKAMQVQWEKESKLFEDQFKAKSLEIQAEVLKSDLRSMQGDTAKIKIKNDWLNGIKKDVYLKETLEILDGF